MKRLTHLLLLGAVLVLVLLGGAAPASAHAELEGTTPQDGTRVPALPSSVSLDFDEAPAVGAVQVVVSAPDGSELTTKDPVLQGTSVAVGLPRLTEAGEYVVAYRIASEDGHPVTGTSTFTVPRGLVAARATDAAGAGTDAGTGVGAGAGALRVIGSGPQADAPLSPAFVTEDLTDSGHDRLLMSWAVLTIGSALLLTMVPLLISRRQRASA